MLSALEGIGIGLNARDGGSGNRPEAGSEREGRICSTCRVGASAAGIGLVVISARLGRVFSCTGGRGAETDADCRDELVAVGGVAGDVGVGVDTMTEGARDSAGDGTRFVGVCLTAGGKDSALEGRMEGEVVIVVGWVLGSVRGAGEGSGCGRDSARASDLAGTLASVRLGRVDVVDAAGAGCDLVSLSLFDAWERAGR